MKVVLGEKYKDKLEIPLQKKGFSCVFIQDNKNIADAVSGHVDMSLFRLNGNQFVGCKGVHFPFEVVMGTTDLEEKYPKNIAYNALIMGQHFFHNLKHTDPIILSLLDESVSLHNVKQGYTKCSVLPIGDKIAITSDIKICKILRECGIDALYIESKFVDLEGYSHGFIGGAGFFDEENTVYFTGKIEDKEVFKQIYHFLSRYNVQIDYLTNDKIFDVGSILLMF